MSGKVWAIILIVVIVLLGGYAWYNASKIGRGGFRQIKSTAPPVGAPTAPVAPTEPAAPAELITPTEPAIKPIAPAAAQPVPSADEVALLPPIPIIYTDDGYAPKDIEIQKGMSVIFKNQSSRDMWPASVMHPTHNVYPTTGGCIGSTFDACSNIAPGGAWSFKFDIAGTWKFHDHLNPGARGEVKVNE